MENKELQQHAEKYGMTVEQVKEARMHIIPYLKYAITNILPNGRNFYLCLLCSDYLLSIGKYSCDSQNNFIERYLKRRIMDCKPDDAGEGSSWFYVGRDRAQEEYKIQHDRKIEWLKWQLKNVKP